jgi:hypothetical protein
MADLLNSIHWVVFIILAVILGAGVILLALVDLKDRWRKLKEK